MKILSVTPIGRWEKHFEEGFRNYVLTLPNGHEKCVWAKKSETFSSFFCSHFPLEARCPSGPLFGKFLFLTYIGKNVNPHYPLEAWSAFEQKTEKFLFPLPISKNAAEIAPLRVIFSAIDLIGHFRSKGVEAAFTPLIDPSGQQWVFWPKTLNIFLFPPSTRDEKVKWSAFQEIFILLLISLKSGFPP